MEKEKCYYIHDAYRAHLGERCVQVSVPYEKNMTIISPNGIEFSNNSGRNINTYLTDERRFQFPYSNIPEFQTDISHYAANQILNLYTPYIQIIDSNIYESCVAHYKDYLYLYRKVLEVEEPYEMMKLTREELINYMKPNKEETTVIGAELNGDFTTNFDQYMNKLTENNSLLYWYHFSNCEFDAYVNNLNKVPVFDLAKNLLRISSDKKHLKIQKLLITYLAPNLFQLGTVNLPTENLNNNGGWIILDKIYELGGYKNMKDWPIPKVPFYLNPDIQISTLIRNKKMEWDRSR